MGAKIFDKEEMIYGIPDATVHRQLLEILRIEGYTIHKVMDNNNFNEYPHIHNAGPYIGGCSSSPGTREYKWVHYHEFLQRLYDHVTKPGEPDWREELSKQFEEKIKSINNAESNQD